MRSPGKDIGPKALHPTDRQHTHGGLGWLGPVFAKAVSAEDNVPALDGLRSQGDARHVQCCVRRNRHLDALSWP
jgi:hypothetical protein